jgi:hypothetical protein
MVFCSRNNSLLWIEAKSARYLDTVLSTEDNPEAIEKSFHKLKYAPWEQTHLAVQKILGADAHPQITRAMSHACLVVSMIDIPLSLFDHGVAVNGTDVSHAFHSLGVGAFELLLVAADAAKEYTLVDILGGAHRQRHRITAKTFILRLMKSADGESSLFRRLQERAADRHGSYFRDHLDAGAGA